MKLALISALSAACVLAVVSLLVLQRTGQNRPVTDSPRTSETTPPARTTVPSASVASDFLPEEPQVASEANSPAPEGNSQTSALSSDAAPRTIILREAAGNRPTALLIESSEPNQAAVEVVIPDRRMLPFALQGQTNPDLPAPVRTVLENIAGEFADNLMTAVEATEAQATSGENEAGASTADTASNSSEGGATAPGASIPSGRPGSPTLPEETLRRARDIADQRYRTFFGDAAFNQAGLQRAIDSSSGASR